VIIILLSKLTSVFEMIEDKINFMIFMFEGLLLIIIILICIWFYGFIRKNLGLDKQTQELKKIRKLLEKVNFKDN
tara:strand:- start:92 stop:316 length:225 start_codon:yes stop_codon:yes gene_type:complete